MSVKSQFSALREIRSWNLDSVKEALINNGLANCCTAFETHNIDGDDLLNLTEGKLALWKRELSLSSIRSVSKFVADINRSPEKFLLRKKSHPTPNAPVKPAWQKPSVQPKAPVQNHSLGSLHTQKRFRQEMQSSPDSDGWDTDFDEFGEDDDINDTPAVAPKSLPTAPMPNISRLYRSNPAASIESSSQLVKPAVPSRPPNFTAKPRFDGPNNPASIPSLPTSPRPPILHGPTASLPHPSRLPGRSNFSQLHIQVGSLPSPPRPPGTINISGPPSAHIESIVQQVISSQGESEYFQIDDDDQYAIIEEENAGVVQPNLPSREPHQFQPPFNIHNGSNFSLRNTDASMPAIQVPQLPARKISNGMSHGPPPLPSREEVSFFKNPAAPVIIPSDHVYPNEDCDDEYEPIENHHEVSRIDTTLSEYLPPRKVSNGGWPSLAAPVTSEMEAPYMRPPSPGTTTLPRRNPSDASSTSSSGGSNVPLSEMLRNYMASKSVSREPSPSPSLTDIREKTPTPPELQGKPPPPPFNQKFQTNQRPLPPTPDPSRSSSAGGAGKVPTLTRQNKVSHKSWFHEVDRMRGEELLRNGEDGCFLVRPSAKSDNPMTLTLWYNSRMYNIGVRHRPDQRYALGTEKAKEQSFGSVDELITHYQREPLVLYSNGQASGKAILTSSPPRQHH